MMTICQYLFIKRRTVMYNKDIRTYAKENNVKLWQIAKAMGISEPTMTRKLRSELPEQDKQTFRRIVDELSAQDATSKEG